MAGRPKPRTRAEEFIARLKEADPAAVEQLRAALWNPDGSVRKQGSTKIMLKPAGAAVMDRYSYLLRRHWTTRAIGVAMAGPRGRREHRPRRRRTAAALLLVAVPVRTLEIPT